MTEWTDEEILSAVHDNAHSCRRSYRELLQRLGAVHPVDARERERKAISVGLRERGSLWSTEQLVDRFYPSLSTPEPPPLTLSTGTWTHQMTQDKRRHLWWRDKAARESPVCDTASDARALAKWLAEYGSEEEKR